MLRKWLTRRKAATDHAQQNQTQFDTLLAQIATRLPDLLWLVVLTQHGQIIGRVPAHAQLPEDAISAMGVAMASLGERVSTELGSGTLAYVLIAGQEGVHLAVRLDRFHLLVLKADHGAAIDPVLNVLRQYGAVRQPPEL